MHQPKCSMETFRCYVQEVDFKKAQAAISRDDFVGKFILTASRRLSPEEEVSVPTLAECTSSLRKSNGSANTQN